jgi:VWFA-related protein
MGAFDRKDGITSYLLRCVVISSALAVIGSAHIVLAQTPQLIPRSHEQREEKFREAHRAILNVKVIDASGNPVAGLKGADFKLLDNELPRPINSVRFIGNGTSPALPRVVLLLDALNQSTREFGEDITGVRKFLANSNVKLTVPTAIAVLSSSGLAVGDASHDGSAVIQQLEEMTRGVKAAQCKDLTDAPVMYHDIWTDHSSIQTNVDQAPKCLNEKFIASVTHLQGLAVKEESTVGRLILIWIGPAWPRLNGKQFIADTPDTKENFFEHLVFLLTAMREGQVTLDLVQDLHTKLATKEANVPFISGVQQVADMTSDSLSAQAISHQSGGQSVDDSRGLPDAIAKCIKDAGSFYVLSFDFPASPDPHQFHSIQVQVNRPGVIARTNTVYYAEP